MKKLIKTLTAANSASLSFVDGTDDVVFDSTYDEYMFVMTDIGDMKSGGGQAFGFQMNAAGASGFDETVTSTHFEADHPEDDSRARVIYEAGVDQAQGTGNVWLAQDSDDAADASMSGILHIFSPSSTTYVTHFYARMSGMYNNPAATDENAAGYFNLTAAVDEIQFTVSSGTFDGVIQMYGIA